MNKEYLTLKDACNFMGLSKSHLYKLTSNNVIRHFKPNGKMIYFDKKDLIEWIKSNEIKSKGELNDMALKFKNK